MLNELARLNELRPSDRKALQPAAMGVVVATPAPPLSAATLVDRTRLFDPSPAAVVSIRVELLRQQPAPQVVEAAAERSISSAPLPPQPTAAGAFEAQAQSRAASAYSFQLALAEPTALAIGPYRRLDVRA